jgi:isopentenyldiphosphate isomerase
LRTVRTVFAASLQRLRRTVERDDHLLTPDVYERAMHLFVDCINSSICLNELHSAAPAYGHPEFFLPVDARGAARPAPEELLQQFRQQATRYPPLELWFRESATRPGEGEGEAMPVLLAARWLGHMVGLRHHTAQLLLGHPLLEDHTLIQVRSLAKIDYPGAYDLAVAGHVTGVDSVEDTLVKELQEELNLEPSDLQGSQRLGSYEAPEVRGERRDIEYRTLFAARLRADALAKIRLPEGEVAGVVICRLPELRRIIDEQPERVASGLRHAFERYLAPGADDARDTSIDT